MSIESEHADMAERLRAIAQIVGGGPIPAQFAPKPVLTDGCNCEMQGNPNRMVHLFGCPYGGPAMRNSAALSL